MRKDKKILDDNKIESIKPWFQLDTWTVKEALLLMSDIDPTGADIEWEGEIDAMPAGLVDGVNVSNALLLSEDSIFNDLPTLKEIENFDEFHTDEEFVEKVKRKMDKLEQAEIRLNGIKRIWDSGQHTDERYPIDYYLKWAREKNIDVRWLHLAEKKGLLKQKSEETKPLDHRERTTFLNIIGALLEFIAGKSLGGSKKHPDFESEAKLIDKFCEYGERGLSNLENKFAEAKKRYK